MFSQTHLQIRVNYDEPAFDCRRILRVLPIDRIGQKIVRCDWKCEPPPLQHAEKTDGWGNRRLFLRHRKIEKQLVFSLEIEAETELQNAPREAEIGAFLWPSILCDITPEIRDLAREIAAQTPREDLATRFCRFVHENLEYQAKIDANPMRASEVWKRKSGACGDFAHLMIALCRAAHLPARYIAGFNPAEGQMHAWVEVHQENFWIPFDPTHGRAPSLGSVFVAMGRDFRDVRPHCGSFRGNGAAKLRLHCKTTVETRFCASFPD